MWNRHLVRERQSNQAHLSTKTEKLVIGRKNSGPVSTRMFFYSSSHNAQQQFFILKLDFFLSIAAPPLQLSQSASSIPPVSPHPLSPTAATAAAASTNPIASPQVSFLLFHFESFIDEHPDRPSFAPRPITLVAALVVWPSEEEDSSAKSSSIAFYKQDKKPTSQHKTKRRT